ncbi:MAG: uridine kinase [Microbacteriaceae bacterium]|nr:uridine kinase [Microbacteriaceae bacterium]
MTATDPGSQSALERVLLALSAAAPPGPRIVGIDGPAGSGKSTLAAAVAAATGAPLVGIDDFLGWTDLDPAGATWWPRLESEVLEPFLAGRDSAYRRRDWVGDPEGISVSDAWTPLAAGPLLVLEGVSVTRAALADRLAVRVWVEAPGDVRLARGLERDGEAQRAHWLHWQAMEQAFFAADGTRGRADVLITTG